MRPLNSPSRSTRLRSTRQSAFTLLELILAVAISGIVGVALFASLETVFNTRDRAINQLAGRNAARITLDLISADLRGVWSAQGLMAGPFVGEDATTANGHDGDSLYFATSHIALSDSNQKGDLRRIEWLLLDDPDEDDALLLVRRITSNLLASTTPEPIDQTLARNVVALNLRYYDGVDWLDQWDSVARANALPQALKITLTLRPPRTKDEQVLTMTRLVMIPAAANSTTSNPRGGRG